MLQNSLSQRLGRYAAVVALLVCGAGLQAADEPSLYIVGPNDALVVTIYNQPQLSGKYVVEADNTFTFPLLGRVKAGGLSLRDIEQELRDRLARGYLRDPQVTVAVDQYRSQQIFVMGEVRTPGSLPLSGGMTLIEALARAGVLTDRAGPEAIIVRPRSGAAPTDPAAAAVTGESTDQAEVIRVNLQTMQTGSMPLNITLKPGDTVFVPRVQTIFVSGRVKSPGEFPMRPSMTVRQAVALAGGITERGSTRRIQIMRPENGAEVTIDAELSDLVRPGDTVVVRERLF